MNKDPKNPFFQKLDEPIKVLVKKYFNEDRAWKYDLEKCRFKTYDEIVARREDCKFEDQLIKKAEIDQKFLE